MPFSITSKSLEESEQLSKPGSVSPDDASDSSVLVGTDDDVDGLSGLGHVLAEKEATAPPLWKSAGTKRPAPSCTFCDEDMGGVL